MPLTMPSTAWSRGASSNTMLAALPPSSRVSFLPDPARVRWICLPTSVEPVKATLSTPGWPTRAAPVAPAPVRMFTTPSGSSASWRISPSRSAVREVVSAGLSTTTWPAAREGVVELVGPAGVVEEVGGGQRHVDVARLLDGLAAVHGLQHRELPRPLLDHPGDAVQVLGPLGAGHARPDLGVGGAGGPHGRLDILVAGLGHLGQDLLGGRVDGLEMPVGGGRHPAAADQQAVVGADLDVIGRLGRRRVPQVEPRRWPLPPPFELLRHPVRLHVGRCNLPFRLVPLQATLAVWVTLLDPRQAQGTVPRPASDTHRPADGLVGGPGPGRTDAAEHRGGGGVGHAVPAGCRPDGAQRASRTKRSWVHRQPWRRCWRHPPDPGAPGTCNADRQTGGPWAS